MWGTMRKLISGFIILLAFSAFSAYADDSPLPPVTETSAPSADGSEPPVDIDALRNDAAQGDVKAQIELADMYYNGRGVPQNYTEAAKWIQMAANEGNADAEEHLAVLYSKGEGVVKDYDQSVQWHRKAADQGDEYSQFNLGLAYELGQGVPKNYDEAKNWYLKAAGQGEPSAQRRLGYLYYKGLGVAQDYAESYFWLALACAQAWPNQKSQDDCVSERNRSSGNLDPEQVEAVQKRASEWKPTITRSQPEAGQNPQAQ